MLEEGLSRLRVTRVKEGRNEKTFIEQLQVTFLVSYTLLSEHRKLISSGHSALIVNTQTYIHGNQVFFKLL